VPPEAGEVLSAILDLTSMLVVVIVALPLLIWLDVRLRRGRDR
jgi:hypothetical protein